MPGPKSFFGRKANFVPKKSAPARRSSSLTSLNRLDESTYSAADLKVHLTGDPEASSKSVIRLKLGETDMAFDRDEATWFLGKDTIFSVSFIRSRNFTNGEALMHDVLCSEVCFALHCKESSRVSETVYSIRRSSADRIERGS